MKKVAISVVSILMVLSLAVGMTACFGGTDPKLQSYLDSDKFQDELKEMNDSLGGLGKVEVTAQGKTMIMTMTVDDSMKELMKQAFEADPDSMTEDFQDAANQMAEETGLSDASLQVIVKCGGDTLFDKTLKAE